MRITDGIFQVCPVLEELSEPPALLVVVDFTDLLDLLDEGGRPEYRVREVRAVLQEEEGDYEDLQDLQATQVIIHLYFNCRIYAQAMCLSVTIVSYRKLQS